MTTTPTMWRRIGSETSVSARERHSSHATTPRRNPASMASREVLPAVFISGEHAFVGKWLPAVVQRILDLSVRPDGWDSYEGSRLDSDVVGPLLEVLEQLGPFIQSPPSVSLTDTGGLLCSWRSSETSLELASEAVEGVHVYFADRTAAKEYDGPASTATALEKWIWQASWAA